MFIKEIIVLPAFLLLITSQTLWAQYKEVAPSVKEENLLEQVQLYPRPATEFLAVRFSVPHSRSTKLILRSLIGNTIKVEKEYTSDYEVRLKIMDLPPGYYLLSIRYAKKNRDLTYRFLKR